jgi:ferrous-iron efflux pump FieF
MMAALRQVEELFISMNALICASLVSFFLAALKGGAYTMSGSILVLASFLDSLMDSVLSWVNYKLSKLALERADHQHPYGHGGFEVVGSLLQGFLIAGSGVLVFFQSLDRIFSPAGRQNLSVDEIPLSLGVMAVSIIAGFAIQYILGRAQRQNSQGVERSLSLISDVAHYRGDLFQNGLALLGLVATFYFGNPMIDALLGGCGGCIVIATSWPLIRDSLKDIMNTSFDPNLQAMVKNIVMSSTIEQVKGMHRLRSRTLGPRHFVDFHLKLPNEITLREAHEISYQIEGLIAEKIPEVDVMIHLDPEDEPDDEL